MNTSIWMTVLYLIAPILSGARAYHRLFATARLEPCWPAVSTGTCGMMALEPLRGSCRQTKRLTGASVSGVMTILRTG